MNTRKVAGLIAVSFLVGFAAASVCGGHYNWWRKPLPVDWVCHMPHLRLGPN